MAASAGRGGPGGRAASSRGPESGPPSSRICPPPSRTAGALAPSRPGGADPAAFRESREQPGPPAAAAAARTAAKIRRGLGLMLLNDQVRVRLTDLCASRTERVPAGSPALTRICALLVREDVGAP